MRFRQCHQTTKDFEALVRLRYVQHAFKQLRLGGKLCATVQKLGHRLECFEFVGRVFDEALHFLQCQFFVAQLFVKLRQL